MVNFELFTAQYADLSRIQHLTVERPFSIDWRTLEIASKVKHVTLGTKLGTKRDPVFDKDSVWVETTAKNVIDFGCEEQNIIQFEMKVKKALMDKMAHLEYENNNIYFQKWLHMLQKKNIQLQHDPIHDMLQSSFIPPITLSKAASKCDILISVFSFLTAVRAPLLHIFAISAPANPGVNAARC